MILTSLLSIQMAVAAPVESKMASIEKAITTELKKLDASIPIETIKLSPMDGVYMVTLKGGHVLYTSANGKYLLRGDMLEVRGNGVVNLSEEVRNKANADLLKSLKVEDMIVFSPKGETKAVVYAFTDVDCGYCRKLHQEVAAMNDYGIELRYLAFPRGGERAPAYDKMVDAWCAADRKKAMTDLKTGKTIPAIEDATKKKVCQDIVESQQQLGMAMGVNGTPAMVLEDGQLIPGYRPADDLANMLKLSK
ncbi:hypothetical protein ACH42_12590 [Endozoicomonas sp. (ex Bugula neritina AB1)]|nr:hypothetical protein ACH42_12590 [Endozoicomonas sp. (ex Bugula neritina AB1)]